MRILLAAVVLLSSTAVANASSTVAVQDGVLTVVAAPGETNDVRVSERTPPGSSSPTEYAVRDSAGTIAGPGCGPDPTRPPGTSDVVCARAAIQTMDVRLGDGDDSATADATSLAVAVHGEAGNDHISMFAVAGTLSDGGDGNDVLDGGEDVRGGAGDDTVTGSRDLDGGDGNDTLSKHSNKQGGRLAGGAGDDSLQSGDGWPDELLCGEGNDTIVSADSSDHDDGNCEAGARVPPPPVVVKAKVTVFELPGFRSRPGRDGRLPVWVRCSVEHCAVTVRILTVGDPGIRGFAHFPHAPLLHLTVGTKAKLFRLHLTRVQRRALRRADATAGIGAVVKTQRPGRDHTLLTDGFYCRRSEPCD
jgi:serralysin